MFSKSVSAIVILLLLCPLAFADDSQLRALEMLEDCNVTWLSPSENAWGSMPLGNGDVGINLWVEPSGEFVFYISKNDAWSEGGALLKIGRVRVRFDPNPIATDQPFEQELKLREGEITVITGKPGDKVSARLWIDAHNPVIMFESNSEKPVQMQVKAEIWRTDKRELTGVETHTTLGGSPIIDADKVLDTGKQELLWCHRNEVSYWDYDKHGRMHPELNLPKLQDPLLHRTFGGLLQGENLKKTDFMTLTSAKPSRKNRFCICVHTDQTDTLEKWQSAIQSISVNVSTQGWAQRREAHRNWWGKFWSRSWIFLDGDEEAERVSQGYNLQRFMNACAGRGKQPILFNGSLFTMPVLKEFPEYSLSPGIEADFRLWGPLYFWQNTRLIYWSMLSSGDFDLMKPLFEMYFKMLPLAKARTRLHFQHDGALFPEFNPWYGPNFSEKPKSELSHSTFYYQSGLEVATMMLAYATATSDREFLKSVAIPFANEVLLGYWEHFQKDEGGKLHMSPAQSLETYWDVVNPTPEIAGLTCVIKALLAVDETYVTVEDLSFWKQVQKAIPDIPTRIIDGVEVISPAEVLNDEERHNWENPELYAIFPYRQFGLGCDRLELARQTYEKRIEKRTGGWFPPSVLAAYLGLADEAANIVHTNFTVENAVGIGHFDTPDEYRFPGFLGPNCNWVPDQDQPSLAMIALQRMILQETSDKVILFGAWPDRWNAYFRLHGSNKMVFTGKIRDGRISIDLNSLSDCTNKTVEIGSRE